MSGKRTGARAVARCQTWLNAVDYLWWVILGQDTRSTRLVPSPVRFHRARPWARCRGVRPGAAPFRFDVSTAPNWLTTQWSGALSSAYSLIGGSQRPKIISLILKQRLNFRLESLLHPARAFNPTSINIHSQRCVHLTEYFSSQFSNYLSSSKSVSIRSNSSNWEQFFPISWSAPLETRLQDSILKDSREVHELVKAVNLWRQLTCEGS
jgi:hypothetical protein